MDFRFVLLASGGTRVSGVRFLGLVPTRALELIPFLFRARTKQGVVFSTHLAMAHREADAASESEIPARESSETAPGDQGGDEGGELLQQ